MTRSRARETGAPAAPPPAPPQAGQPGPEARAAAERPLGGDRAAVRLRDLAHDREAEAGPGHAARRRRAVEAVEDEGDVLLGDPGAEVAHGHLAAGDGDLDDRAVRAP